MSDNATTLAPLQRIVYETIAEILETKQGAVEPCIAHINEIHNSINVELMEALRELYRRGIISVSKDINQNPMFQIKNPIKS